MSEQTFEEALASVGTGIGLDNAINAVRAAHSRALAEATEEVRRERDEARAEAKKLRDDEAYRAPICKEIERERGEFKVRAEKAEADVIKHLMAANGFSFELAKAEAECERLREALATIMDDPAFKQMDKATLAKVFVSDRELTEAEKAHALTLKEPSRD